MLAHEKLSNIYDRALSDGLESLSDKERELYSIQDFIIELEMNGLSGYFYNRLPHPTQISTAIYAMRKYGLNEVAALLEEGFHLFEGYSGSSAAKTWSDALNDYDPNHQLRVLEKKIDAIEDYGLEASLIESL